MVSEQLDQAQRINCKILVQVPQLKYHLAIFFYLSSGSRSFALPSTWTFRTGISLFYFLKLSGPPSIVSKNASKYKNLTQKPPSR